MRKVKITYSNFAEYRLDLASWLMYSPPLPDIIVGLGPFRMEDEAEAEGSGETRARRTPRGSGTCGWAQWVITLCREDRAPWEALASGLESQKYVCQSQRTSGCQNWPPDFLSILG